MRMVRSMGIVVVVEILLSSLMSVNLVNVLIMYRLLWVKLSSLMMLYIML